MKLLHEANGNTVLLRGSERVRGVTLEGGGDAGLVNTTLYKLIGDGLSTFLGEEEVPLSGTGSLVGVTGELDLGVRILSHEGSDLIELGNLGSLDIPLVDDEVDVLLELGSRGGSGLLNNDGLRFRFRSRCRSGSRGGCRRRNDYRSGSGLLGGSKSDLEAYETGVLLVEVGHLASALILLGVEVIGKSVHTSLKVELDGVGETDVETETGTSGGAESLAIPHILEAATLGLDSLGLIVVEAHVGADTEVSIRAQDTVKVDIENIGDVKSSIEGSLGGIELVDLSLGLHTTHGTLCLPAHSVAAEAEDRGELIAEREISGRGKEVNEVGLTDSLGNTTTQLEIPVRVELLSGSADTHHHCSSKNKYSFFHKFCSIECLSIYHMSY